MRRNLNGEHELLESIEGKPVMALSGYRGTRQKMLFRCLVCGWEWESEPRDLIRAVGHGCRKCAAKAHRKPNEILSEKDRVLTLNVSSKKWPEGVMLIYRKKWDILLREGIGRVKLCPKGYPKAKYRGKVEFVHRILMKFPKEVDHKNGVKWDNRMCNLRVATGVQNQMNRGMRKTNTSGVIGISPRAGGWEAKLCVGRVVVHRSRHKTIEAATEARRLAVLEHCGEFAPAGL